MVNSKDFSKRLETIMDREDLNASSFAERIGVGRSSVSHILSGRNKPSLDFVLGVLKQFPEVDLYWLLNGKGSYPKTTTTLNETNKLIDENQNSKLTPPASTEIPKNQQKVPTEKNAIDTVASSKTNSSKNGKNISKLILIYEDGTFESFIP